MAESPQNNVDRDQLSKQENQSTEIQKILNDFINSGSYQLKPTKEKDNKTKKRSKNIFLKISLLYLLTRFSLIPQGWYLNPYDLGIYEQCVLVLQESQKNIKEIENDWLFVSINKNIKGKNLFQELKKIKIDDAPRDFSTNFDSYISWIKFFCCIKKITT